MSELEEALWNVPIKSTQVIKKYIRDNYISKDKIGKIIYSNNEDLEIILKIKKLLEENNE